MRIKIRYKRMVFIVSFVLLVILSLAIGSYHISIADLIKGDALSWTIFLNSRVPRTLAIIISGISLSLAGLLMQSLGKNKFISPGTTGATDAALLGMIIGYLFLGDQSKTVQMVFSFVLSLLAMIFFMFIVNKIKIKEKAYIPLIGLMYGAIISSMTTLIAYQFNVYALVSAFSVGSFAKYTSFNLLFINIIPLVLIVAFATTYSIMSMGEDMSKGLGVRYKTMLFIGLSMIAIVSSTTFITVGPIPFIGLIVPNLVAALYGENMKKTLFDVAILGAIMVLMADVLGRIFVYPHEIPVSLTMGLFGGIVFIMILFRRLRYAKKTS